MGSTWNLRPHGTPMTAAVLGIFLLPGLSTRVSPAQMFAQMAGQPQKQAASRSGIAAPPHGGSASLPAPRPGWNYPQRQTLTYEVDWRVYPAGTAVVHVESNGDAQRISISGDSQGAFNLLFRVNDHFQSTFSRQAGCSSDFTKQLIEGTRQVTSDQQFSGGQSRAVDDEKTLISHSHHAEQIVTPPCVADALSALLYAASQPLQVGQQFHIPVVYGANVLDVTAHVEAHEAVRTPTATYQALRVQPTWTNPAVKNSGNIWVWYTDDDRHIPVQVRARLFWGTITFRLTTIEQK